MEIVTVANKEIKRLEYNGQPVVTVKMIAEVHGKRDIEVNQNITYNKSRFIEGLDVITVNSSVLRSQGYKSCRDTRVFTESGYLKLVKTFTDDLAWEVQGKLVDAYFHCKKQATAPIPATPSAPTSQLDLLRLALGAIEETAQIANTALTTSQNVSDRFTVFEESRRLENHQQKALLDVVRHKVALWQEVYENLNTQRAFQTIWRHLNNYFNVPRYSEIPAKHFNEAMQIVKAIKLDFVNGNTFQVRA